MLPTVVLVCKDSRYAGDMHVLPHRCHNKGRCGGRERCCRAAPTLAWSSYVPASLCLMKRMLCAMTCIACASMLYQMNVIFSCAGVSVHVINSMVAWLDILLSQPRSFSRRSQLLSIGFAVFYLHWILLCSHINGSFPYPFLNKLPQPQACRCALSLYMTARIF